MKIAVVAGGLSPERDVSLSSGCLIANALLDRGHQVVLVDVYLGMNVDGEIEGLFSGEDKRYEYQVPPVAPDLKKLAEESPNGGVLIGPNVLEICEAADLVFVALHGDIGENGQLQAVFDSFGIRYTGTGYAGSMLAMDKQVSKELMCYHGITTPSWILCNPETYSAKRVEEEIGFPCVVKPVGCGSSVGVSMVYSPEELDSAVMETLVYEEKFLVEKRIDGREFSVGILDGKALPVIEILPTVGFYDYKNKYQAGLTREVCPAEIDDGLREKIQALALRVHTVLRLGSYSRIDFMVERGGNIFCLEANTLPGMTPTSLLPQEAAAAGIPYKDLCEKIVHLAM